MRESGYQNFPEGSYDNQAVETYPSNSEVVEEEESLNDETFKDLNSLTNLSDQEGGAVQYQNDVPVANPAFRKAIRWLVYVAAFLTPLWFLPFTADPLEFNKQTLLIVVAGIGLVLYLVDIIKSGVVRYKPSLFYFPIFGLVVASAISVIFSVNRTVSLFGAGESRSATLITLTSLAIIFFLALNAIDDRGKALKKIIISSLSLAFIFGTLQILGLFLFRGAGFASKSFNSVGSLNALGILAALALAFFTSSGLARKSDEEKSTESNWSGWVVSGLHYLGLVSALFVVVFINWWPVWAIAFVALLVSVAFASAGDARLLKAGRMRLFAIPMTVIVLGVFLILVNFNWTSLKSKLPVEVAPSQQSSWKIAFESLKSRPLGQGAENFAVAYDKFKSVSIANTIFYQIRFTDGVSEAVNTAVEGGVLVILGFLALFWFYSKELVGRVGSGFGGNRDASAIWAASCALVVAYFLYPFGIVAMALLFLLLALGVLSAGQSQERIINLESDTKYSFLGSLAFILGLILVLVAGYFTLNNYVANAYMAKAIKSSDRNKAIEYFVASANSNANDARTYRLLSQTVLAQLADDLKSGPKKNENQENYNSKIQNQIASAVNIAIRATNVNPADSQNWINRGLIYENLLTLVSGADQAAINTYNESLARNPADPATYLRIGNVYLTLVDALQRAVNNPKNQNIDFAVVRKQINDNLTKAEDSFKKAISLYNNFGQALYNLAVVYDRENKLPDAIKQFEKLRLGNPRDPSIAFQIGLLYYRNNQKNNAFTAWQQAVLLFPNYSNARWYLSLVYEERGDLDGALKQVEEIKKFNPDNELVKQRLVQLRSGKRTIPPDKVLDKKPLDQ